MVPKLEQLQLEWVSKPREEWLDDLDSMADNYPFENEKKSFETQSRSEILREEWLNNDDDSFLSAHFSDKLVGWIKVEESPWFSRVLDRPFLRTRWELIQRNRDDVRSRMVDTIIETHPEAFIEFTQPTQNRTARAFFQRKTSVETGQIVAHLGKNIEGSVPRKSEDPEELQSIDELDNYSNIGLQLQTPKLEFLKRIRPEEQSLSEKLTRSRLNHYSKNSRKDGWFYADGGDIKTAVLVSPISDKASSDSSHVRLLCPGMNELAQGESTLKEVLSAVEIHLTESGVDRCEYRIPQDDVQLFESLADAGYSPLTKRMTFYRIPAALESPPI